MTKTRPILIWSALAAALIAVAMHSPSAPRTPVNAEARDTSIAVTKAPQLVRNRTLVPKAVRLIIGFKQTVTV